MLSYYRGENTQQCSAAPDSERNPPEELGSESGFSTTSPHLTILFLQRKAEEKHKTPEGIGKEECQLHHYVYKLTETVGGITEAHMRQNLYLLLLLTQMNVLNRFGSIS